MPNHRPRANRAIFFLVSGTLAFGGSGAADAASFQGIGDLGGELVYTAGAKISADGSTIVGGTRRNDAAEAFRWTAAGGFEFLGFFANGGVDSFASGVSGDGSTVVGGGSEVAEVGEGSTSYQLRGFRWTSATGLVGLDFPNQAIGSVPSAMTPDGSTLVGNASLENPWEAFRWTASAGVVGLGDLPGGVDSSNANGVSGDGSNVVGASHGSDGNEAFRWTSAGGMVGLGDLAGGTFLSLASDISLDGSTIVGYGQSDSGQEAFVWTESEGMIGLGDLPGGFFLSGATAVSPDGSKVFGYGQTDDGPTAFVWDRANGMRTLASVLTSVYGLDLSGWHLVSTTSISADGSTIVGNGYHAGKSEVWIAVIPEPGAAILVGVGLGGLAAGRKRRNPGSTNPT